MYRTFVKTTLDFLMASIFLVLASPIITVVAVCLYWANGGSVWFLQDRPGKNGRTFRVIKFKTMNDQRDTHGHLLSDDQRLTPIGKFVRTTSVDELPQLINVLKGDMSFVGPRPLLMEYLPLYNEQQKRRHEVKPGITGWAQVHGRNALPWKERFEHDVWYVDHQSFWLDLKILFLTVVRVFRAEGINSGTSVTMEKFRGNS